MTAKAIMDGLKKYYKAMGFDVTNMEIEDNGFHGGVTIKTEAKLTTMFPSIPQFVSMDYGAMEFRAVADQMATCPHDYEEKQLFTSTYKKCKICGDEA